MKTVTLVLVIACMLSGCATIRNVGSAVTSPLQGITPGASQSQISGVRFRTRITSITSDDRGFVTNTGGADRALPAALEAARLRAVEYCLRRFGGSQIVWVDGPDRETDQIALDAGGSLTLTGACVVR